MQGMKDRMDEKLGMKDGPARMKKQGYKDRRDESYGMKGMGMGVMGHEKMPKGINAFAAQKKDMKKVDMKPMDYRGSPDKAFDYKY